MGILNYSSTVQSVKTAGEVVAILAKHGASSVITTYADGVPTGVGFQIATDHGPRDYQLPVNVDGVEAAIKTQIRKRQIPPRYAGRAQAERTAWRIVKDWIEAQLAVIEAGQAKLDEVMLPYMLMGGSSVIAAYRRNQVHNAIEAAS